MPTEDLLPKTEVHGDRTPGADAGGAPLSAASGAGKPRRALRFLLAAMLLSVSVYPFHALALRWLAEPLAAGAPRLVDADLICMVAGADGLAEVVTACRQRPACRVLLIPWRANRLTEVGVATSGELQFRRFLEDAGVAGSQIEVIQPPIATDWELAERLADRLAADSTASVVILCDQFSGRRWRYIVCDTVPDEMARRIHVQSAENSVVRLHDWWRTKAGIQGVVHGYLGLLYVFFHGRESAPVVESSAEVYEALARRRSIPE
jgi:hypothetical protein